MIWLKFAVNGRDYAVTLDRLSIAEAREVKRFTGVTLHALMLAGSGQVDGDVLAAVVFLAKRRAGEEIDWAEIDQIDVLTLVETMTIASDTPDSAEPGVSDPPAPAKATTNGKAPAKRTSKPRAAKPAATEDQEPAVTS